MIESDKAEQLRDLMAELSQRCYCAGWMDGTERKLYQVAFHEANPAWGNDRVTPSEVVALRDLAEFCGMWWHWPDDVRAGDGPVPIPLADAERLYGGERVTRMELASFGRRRSDAYEAALHAMCDAVAAACEEHRCVMCGRLAVPRLIPKVPGQSTVMHTLLIVRLCPCVLSEP